ncbi:tetrahydrofolate dehydrogenase/cyclohydrolase catalytic domain-containing protein [Nonomuraea salmonea]|uniref:tetrahydrofolate dehydrogenase/cyclohydrolase catalytic domain-containing protein n=1 Tax=Nonomuraea salmonea TaxID=46181 RepID=UPI0031E93FAE
MKTLTGKDLAAAIRAQTQAEAAAGVQPRLAVVVATADEASLWYVRSIAKAAAGLGIACDVVDLGPDAAPRPDRRDAGQALRRARRPRRHAPDPAAPRARRRSSWPPPSTRVKTSTAPTRSRSAGWPPGCPRSRPPRRPP